MSLILWLAIGCTGSTTDTAAIDSVPDGVREVPWSMGLERLDQQRRGRVLRRAIAHLHSPWSHDACDGDPQPYGVPNEPCLKDLRYGLCNNGIDVAFLTDHPSHAAEGPYEGLFLERGDDAMVDGIANGVACDDGTTTLWMPGIEDDLMPLGLEAHVPGDAEARDDLYHDDDATALAALQAVGAEVFVAHTESRDIVKLSEQQDAGLAGIEVFNLHAMFAPDIRPEFLGLEPFDWVTDIEPFTGPEGTAEPDLLFLGVLMDQPPTLANWDALLARGPMAGIGGTDAHQNVLPILLRDGDRGDSYRRMLRWFSNHLIADDTSPVAARDAIGAGRAYVAFEVLGTPDGFDVYADGSTTTEMGGQAALGDTLHVTCPTLHPSSPRGLEDPEVTVTVLKDGQPWQTDCGDFALDEAGAYRVRVDVVPHHLLPFLGDDPDPWLRSFPWIYGNAIRVE